MEKFEFQSILKFLEPFISAFLRAAMEFEASKVIRKKILSISPLSFSFPVESSYVIQDVGCLFFAAKDEEISNIPAI